MSPQEILAIVHEITRFAETEQTSVSQTGEIPALEVILDKLALAYHFTPKTDSPLQIDQGEPPSVDYNNLRKAVAVRFPGFGFYHASNPHIEPDKWANVLIGDAVDDLADIVRDMLAVEWYWSNISATEALWHFRWGYEHHWGEHLRDLQKYIYAQQFLLS